MPGPDHAGRTAENTTTIAEQMTLATEALQASVVLTEQAREDAKRAERRSLAISLSSIAIAVASLAVAVVTSVL